MAWSYNSSTKVLTATTGTQASPNLLSAGVAIVAAADSTAGYQNGLYSRLNNVQIDVTVGAWVKWDDYAIFEFTGSTRYNPYGESSYNANNGGSTIFGIEMVCNVNTTTTYFDSSCLVANTGGTFISLRSPAGRNPYIYQQTSTRNDFPTFITNYYPAVINIAGLTIRQNSVSGASRKVYFGLARTVTAASNVNFEGTTGEFQTASTTYTGYQSPIMVHSGDSFTNTSNFYASSWGAEQSGTIDFAIGASARLGNYLNYNPVFPVAAWTGTYSIGGLYWSADNRYAATMYSHTPTFKAGLTKLANVVVQWLGTQTTGTTIYTISNISESLSKTATTTSTGTVSNYLLSAMIGRQSSANGTSNKYQWSCKARAYNYATADQYLWSSRSFLSDGTNGPITEDVQLLSVPYLTLTQAQAAALTGISLLASDANGGVITLTSNKTASEVWAYYRNWISTLANFGSNDTWEFDNTTLNLGSWTIVGLEYLTSGKVISSSSTAGGAFTASTTGNVSQATPTNLTGVTITGNLTYNTNTPITVTLTNCSISGTVSNSGTGLVTISLGNTTIGTVGANIATRPVTALTLTGLTAGSQIYIAYGTGTQVAYVASSGTSYTLDTTGQTGVWSFKVARYGYTSQTGAHMPAIASTTLLITLVADAFITQATKATVAAYTTLENLDNLYDYAAYYETTNAGIAYSRVITKAGTSASANAYNVTLNNSGAVWAFTGSALTINSNSTLASGTTITGSLFTTASVTLTTAQTNTAITGNVLQTTPTNLTGVTITGNLTYNTNTPITVTLTNCSISGTVSNSGTGLVTISLGNTTIGTVGANIATRPVTALTLTGLTAGSQIYIAYGTGTQVAYVASSGTSYTLDTTGQTGVWSFKVARYGYTSQTGAHMPAIASTTLLITLVADAFITQATKATVAAYTTLENLDNLYDYAAYYETTNAGIAYSRVITKAGTSASANAYNVTLNNSGAVWAFTGSALTINSNSTLASGTTITGSLFTTASVTLTTAQTNTAITGNVLQTTPTNLFGVVITGSITYNYNTNISVTFTDCVVTGTINNSNVGTIKVFRAGTSDWFTEGTNVLVRANVSITTSDNLALTTAVLQNGSINLGWVPQETARVLEVAQGDTFSIYAIAYGYQASLFSAIANDFTTFRIALIPEIYINTTLDITTRDIIVSKFSSYRDDNNRLPLTINEDLRNYSTAEVLNALQYYIVTQGYWFGTAVIFGAPINGFTFIQGGVYIAYSKYYWKVDDSVTTPTNLGYLLPIVIGVDASVYIAYPTYSPVKMNTSDIVMQYAPWTHITAEISSSDKIDIANLSSDKVWIANNRTLNNALFE